MNIQTLTKKKRQIDVLAKYDTYDYKITMRSCRQAKNLRKYIQYRLGYNAIQRGRDVYYKNPSGYIPWYIKK